MRGGKKPGVKPFKLWQSKKSKTIIKAEEKLVIRNGNVILRRIVKETGMTRKIFIVWQNQNHTE